MQATCTLLRELQACVIGALLYLGLNTLLDFQLLEPSRALKNQQRAFFRHLLKCDVVLEKRDIILAGYR